MQKIYSDYKQIVNYLFVILYLITGSLSNFGAIDILAPQWIYLGSVNLLVCSYILFFSTNDFKEPWIKYILSFTAYIFIISLTIIFFNENQIVIKNLALSFIFSIALFPLFFFIVDKLSYRFRSYNE